MAKIKFRVWSGEIQHYIESPNKPEVLIRSDGKPFFNDDVATINDLKPLKIEQSTGLKDKNGRDLYEGDQVLIRYGHEAYNTGGTIDRFEMIGIVSLDHGAFVVTGFQNRYDINDGFAGGAKFSFYEIFNDPWFIDPVIVRGKQVHD